MSFDPHPVTWLGSGYTLSSHVAGFNTNDASSNKTLTQLTDAQATASTGDIRYIAYALCEKLYSAWVAQGTSGQPKEMTISKNVNSKSDGTIDQSYTLRFNLTPPTGAAAITAEP